MIDFSFLIYDAPLWFIFWVWTKVLLSDSSGNVKKKIHMLICNHWVTTKRASTVSMHFLDPKIPVLGGMQKQASKLCILTWYGSNYGQFWILQTEANVQFFKLKLMTKIEFNFSNFFTSILIILCAAKIQMRLFVVFQPFFCLKFHVGIFVPYFDLKNRLKNKYS